MPGQVSMILRQIDIAFNAGTVAGLTDRQLVERFAARRGPDAEAAFAALVGRHGTMVLRVCRNILRDHHDTQDAFQATFLILARKAGSLWVEDSLGPWLYGVACRVASTSKAAAARRRTHESKAARLAADLISEKTPDDSCAILHEELAKLPDRYRATIVLCDLEGAHLRRSGAGTGSAGRDDQEPAGAGPRAPEKSDVAPRRRFPDGRDRRGDFRGVVAM